MTKFFGFVVFAFCFFVAASPVFGQSLKPPVLSIGSPRNADSILGNRVTVSFIVGNFTFIDFHQKKTKAKNEGHIHMFLDQEKLTLENANEVLSHDDVIFNQLPEGIHTLVVQLVNNDHTPYKPNIETALHFSTHLPAPTLPPTPTLMPLLSSFSQHITREQILAVDGIALFIIGFIVFLIFGRKKFIK